MKVIEGPYDTTRPGFYYDGTTVWLVDTTGCIWSCGVFKENIEGIPSGEGLDSEAVVDIIDAVGRVVHGRHD